MADGTVLYIFGFGDVTKKSDGTYTQASEIMQEGTLKQSTPAPTIIVKEGEELFLNLTNVGMLYRPDLFDPHTVHWHGFPEAASVFDGVPDSSLSIGMGATFTYYYKANDPGTYMYHCHVEAAEHMQMGMLGNLWVLPKQNDLPDNTDLNGFTHHTGYTYAYNDGDGSTYYDKDFPVQLGSFDSEFHFASFTVQPLPFALMKDNYPLINGRGYPDTTVAGSLPDPKDGDGNSLTMGKTVQNVSTKIVATQGEKILLRFSNLNITRFYTIASASLPMTVVGKDAKLLQNAAGVHLYHKTNSVTIGGGESTDAIIDTAGVPAGTYVLYTTNLNYLSNNKEDFGGMMTEIVIQP